VNPPPEISKRPGPFVYWVKDIGNGRVVLTRSAEETHGIKMPAASVKHFVNDLSGKVEGPKSKRPEIQAVLSGKATFLGKGDDGLAFRVKDKHGDKVVKVSTTVPYIPENDYHATPEEAIHRLREQTKMHNRLADVTGNTCLQRAEFVVHGDKGFQIKPYVEGVVQFTRDELDRLQDCVIAIHKAGYAIRDNVQAGLGPKGQPVMFDVGKAKAISPEEAQATTWHSPAGNDMEKLADLYKESGHEFVRRDHDEGQQAWDKAVSLAMTAVRKTDQPALRGVAWRELTRAAEKRRAIARATLKGDALIEKLQDADEALRWRRDDLAMDDIEKVLGEFEEWYQGEDPVARKDRQAEVEHAVARALTAGARPPLRFQGMGGEGIVICDARGHAYKMGRSRDLADEAAWLETAMTLPEVAKHVARMVTYHPEVDAIERECVPRTDNPMPRWKVDLWDLHDTIQKEMRKNGWTAPEYKEDSYIETADRGFVLVDAGFVQRLGDRMASYVEDVLAGRRPWRKDKPKDLAWALEADFAEPRPARVEALLAELKRREDAG
jgi:hypothetical protein